MNNGFSIVEFITAMALFVIIASVVSMLTLQGISLNRSGLEQTKATFLAQQVLDATASIQNQGYANLTNGQHGLVATGGSWAFSGTATTTGKYTQSVTISDGQRTAGGLLVESGGTPDPDTKHITTQVSWPYLAGQTKSISMQTYITNWRDQTAGGPTPTPTVPGPTSTPIVTNTPIPPTPTTAISTCSAYCLSQSYSTGTCRQNAGKCTQNGETHVSAGDNYCTGGSNADTCCCQ